MSVTILHDPRCAEYHAPGHPEQPARVVATARALQAVHPAWRWRTPDLAAESDLLLAHAPAHLARLHRGPDFDADTAWFPGIHLHARRSVGAALEAVECTLNHGQKTFALMRPPGHHASAGQAMGFCYLNQVAIAALAARRRGVARVAVWDFDAHHGNGTEAILHGREGVLFASVHQYPGYPGTGAADLGNCRNWPVPPGANRGLHRDLLARSWEAVCAFRPEVVLVSAGFDAFRGDPITEMSLETEDFGLLGKWLADAKIPAAAILEGGYSPELPGLVDAFLSAWDAP